MDTEKRIRREIANSNERRRMQSINAGFNSLKTMLPKHDGEKLSKAAILQHTAEYIDSLEQEKTRLLSQHHQLKRLISSIVSGQQDVAELAKHSLVKKIKTEHNSEFNSDSSDEGIHCNVSPVESFDNIDELKTELIEVRKAVGRERKLRMQLEEQVKALETQLYPERVKEIAQSVQVKLNHPRHHHSSSLHASASETGSLDNSENENEAAVASLVDDVIAETIEIESGSCPGSPITSTAMGSHQTIVIQQPGSSTNGTSIGPTSHVIHLDASALRSIAAASLNNKSAVGKASGEPNAIALPIEVPFMGGIVNASSATVSKSNSTTGQSSNSNKTNSSGAISNSTSNIQVSVTTTPTTTGTGTKSGTTGTTLPSVVTTRVSSVIVSTTNSSNSGNNSSSSSSTNSSNNITNSNGKEAGKNGTSNGSVTTNNDGKSTSATNTNTNSNKSSTSTTSSSSTKSAKQQISSNSSLASSQPRHNLETIVEAIRHLEGDHMFKDDDSVAIEVEEEVEVPLTETETTIFATTSERK